MIETACARVIARPAFMLNQVLLETRSKIVDVPTIARQVVTYIPTTMGYLIPRRPWKVVCEGQ